MEIRKYVVIFSENYNGRREYETGFVIKENFSLLVRRDYQYMPLQKTMPNVLDVEALE